MEYEVARVPLEAWRREHGLSLRAMAAKTGVPVTSVQRHCTGACMQPEKALAYSRGLGIPLSVLRPDLWPADGGAVETAAPSAPAGRKRAPRLCRAPRPEGGSGAKKARPMRAGRRRHGRRPGG